MRRSPLINHVRYGPMIVNLLSVTHHASGTYFSMAVLGFRNEVKLLWGYSTTTAANQVPSINCLVPHGDPIIE